MYLVVSVWFAKYINELSFVKNFGNISRMTSRLNDLPEKMDKKIVDPPFKKNNRAKSLGFARLTDSKEKPELVIVQ